MYTCICSHVYVHIAPCHNIIASTPGSPTNIVGFGGFDSSTMLILRGGILMSIGDFPESSSQAMLVCVMLVGGLGVIAYDILHYQYSL